MAQILNNRERKFSILNFQFSILLLLAAMFAQTAFGQMKVRLGATAGANFATISERAAGATKYSTWDVVPGLRGGAVVDFGFSKFFSVVPEVVFSQKGWKSLKDKNIPGFDQTATINYVEMPIDLVLKLKVGRDVRITLFPGFYAAYALSGKIKTTTEGFGTSTETIPLGTGVDDMNPLDMGFVFGLGLEVKSLFFRFQGLGGLKNMNNDKADKTEITNTAFSLNLGYYFK
jgi:hypothetical protein